MLEWVGGFVGALKGATPALLLGIAVASAITLFMGNDLASSIGLSDFRQTYRPYLGGALVLSLSLVLGKVVWACFESLTSLLAEWNARREAERDLKRKKEVLHKLTPEEKGYLHPYIAEAKNTCTFGLGDGIAGGLVAKGILYRASNVGNLIAGFAHNLQPWAREHLEANPDCLKGAQLRRSSHEPA